MTFTINTASNGLSSSEPEWTQPEQIGYEILPSTVTFQAFINLHFFSSSRCGIDDEVNATSGSPEIFEHD